MGCHRALQELTMKRTLQRAFVVVVLLVACVILIFLASVNLAPAPRPYTITALTLDIMDVQNSSLSRSLIFPALRLINMNKLHLENLAERDCSAIQKYPSPEYKAVPEAFRPSVTRTERFVMLLTLQVFIKTMEEHGLTYFLYGGTLLGAFRHHGFVPWDDDIDVLVRSGDKKRLCPILSNVPGYTAYCPDHFQWKFFRQGLATLPWKRFRWPNVDIFFFSEDSNSVIDDLAKRVYRRKDVFPLRDQPFEGAMLPVPQNTKAVLEKNFKTDSCKPVTYCHKAERSVSAPPAIPCSQLYGFHPFVHRAPGKDGWVEETLMQGDRVLHTHLLPPVSSPASQHPPSPAASTQSASAMQVSKAAETTPPKGGAAAPERQTTAQTTRAATASTSAPRTGTMQHPLLNYPQHHRLGRQKQEHEQHQ